MRIFNEHNISLNNNKSIEEIVSECDKNGDGEIDYKEFL
jgi:Ca2+-binding EF-hand superfamily protein